MQIDTVIYRSANPLSPAKEYLAFLVVEANEIVDRKKTGRKVKDTLSVVFYGTTPEGARDKAIAFWEEETAKAKARVERGKKLGESRRKSPAGHSGS